MAKSKQSYKPLAAGPKKGIWAAMPWLGLVSLLIGVAAAISALIIGLVSDGQPLDSWRLAGSGRPIQPSVALSITYTIGNIALSFAFSEGVAIAWWNSAASGATLLQLQATYDHAYRRLSLFTLFSHWSRVSLASILMLVLLADGPLLQRASTVRSITNSRPATLDLPISSSPLSLGATGILVSHSDDPSLYTPAFGQIVQQYNTRANITIPNSGCQGTCTFEIIAPGWDVRCQNSTQPFRLANQQDFIDAQAANVTLAHNDVTAFNTTVGFVPTNFSSSNTDGGPDIPEHGTYLSLATAFKSTPGFNATTTLQNCQLAEALVRYQLHMNNDTVALDQPFLGPGNNTVELIYRGIETGSMGNWPSSLGGFYIALGGQFDTSATLSMAAPFVAMRIANSAANTYLEPSLSPLNLSSEEVRWTSPMPDMISMANELAFRSAIGLTNYTFGEGATPTSFQTQIIFPNLTLTNRTISQKATGLMATNPTVYKTDMGWLGSGIAIMFLACIAIMPLYWGWWKHGVRMNLNPVRVAAAFDAPILRTSTMRDTRVQYTIVQPGDTKYDPGFVAEPQEMKAGASEVSEASSVMDSERQGVVAYGFQRVEGGLPPRRKTFLGR